MINVGFIGLGEMGAVHVDVFGELRGCRIVAGADVSERSRANFARTCPDATLYSDYRDLLKNSRVDAVVVAVPTLYHKQLAIDAMKSGRPVMTEKPMARTVADARRMNDVAQKTGQILMVAHCRRFDTDWGCFGKIVQSGRLGAPVLWRHVSAGHGPPRAWFVDDKLSGGPLMDGAVHNYDYANFLFGEPDSVVASAIKLTDASAVDTATAVVRYRSANQLMLSWSWGVARGDGSHDMLAPKGSLRFGPADLLTDDLDTKTFGYYNFTDRKTGKSRLFKFKRKNMYLTQAKHYLDCIGGKTNCMSPGTEAIKAVAVAEAILKAAPKGAARKVRW